MVKDTEAFGFAEMDPDWSLELGPTPVKVYADDESGTVVLEQDGGHTHFYPARARELAIGLERGPDETENVVRELREAADRVEGTTIRLKVPLPRVKQARETLEPGLFKVTQEEARLIIQGMAAGMARDCLNENGGTTKKDEVNEEAAEILRSIGDEVQG